MKPLTDTSAAKSDAEKALKEIRLCHGTETYKQFRDYLDSLACIYQSRMTHCTEAELLKLAPLVNQVLAISKAIDPESKSTGEAG